MANAILRAAAMAVGVAVAATGAPAAAGGTLARIKERGELVCGVNADSVPGFVVETATGKWAGFDVDYCRAIAAALLGNPEAVRFVPLSTTRRLAALASGDVDLLARNTTWTFSRDLAEGFDFAAVTFFDGQGFMVRSALGLKSAFELDGLRICVLLATTSASNLDDFFAVNSMEFAMLGFTDDTALLSAYAAGRCEAVTGDVSRLGAWRTQLEDAEDHVILPDVISKEPLALVVRDDDPAWTDLVRWTHFALLAAEEFGIRASDLPLEEPSRPRIARLLGHDRAPAAAVAAGLDPDWAARAIAAVGNYGELFARHFGGDGASPQPRGLNALWTEGGLHYPMPFR